MDSKQIKKQVTIATLEAEGARRLYSEIGSKTVRNGQGGMSQRYYAEMMESRAARY